MPVRWQTIIWTNDLFYWRIYAPLGLDELSHLGQVTHIHVYTSVNYASIVSDRGLSPVQHQAIIWTIASLLLIGSLRTSFSEIWTKIQQWPSKKMRFICRQMALILPPPQWVINATKPGWSPLHKPYLSDTSTIPTSSSTPYKALTYIPVNFLVTTNVQPMSY